MSVYYARGRCRDLSSNTDTRVHRYNSWNQWCPRDKGLWWPPGRWPRWTALDVGVNFNPVQRRTEHRNDWQTISTKRKRKNCFEVTMAVKCQNIKAINFHVLSTLMIVNLQMKLSVMFHKTKKKVKLVHIRVCLGSWLFGNDKRFTFVT